jgi:hypothetical protein
MALDTGFFDSITATLINGFYQGDKAKPASFMAAWIKSIVRTGYNPAVTDCFKIVPSSAMTVSRSAGNAFIEGYFVQDTAAATHVITANHTHVCIMRLDSAAGTITETWLIDPVLNTDYPLRVSPNYDLVLATVVVPSGATEVTADMITDNRDDFALCGYAKMAAAGNYEFSGMLEPDGKVNPIRISANIVEVTANKTLALTDAGTIQKVNSASAVVITVPLHSTVEFPVETQIEIKRYGSGAVTIIGEEGVTIHAMGEPATIPIFAQYGSISLTKYENNVWCADGAVS